MIVVAVVVVVGVAVYTCSRNCDSISYCSCSVYLLDAFVRPTTFDENNVYG